jgi:serine/threonine protein phosphatase PrpC
MREAAGLQALSFGASDRGPRENNEDELHFDDERGIYFVVDGMGGHAAGEHAARIAKQRLIGRLERPIGTVEQRIREAIALANTAVHDAAAARADWHGMACVMTVAVVADGQVTVGHVGDSRLYLVTAHGLEKVTRDHSPVGQQEDAGEITEAEAMGHPRRNEVYRDVGSQPHQPDDAGFIDVYPPIPFDAGSAFLLCSDGLSDVVSSAEIRRIINEHRGDRATIVRELVRRAADDGKDNVTAVFVQGPSFGITSGVTRRKLAKRKGPRTAIATLSPATVERLPVHESPSRWRLAILWVLAGMALTLGTEYLLHSPPFDVKAAAPGPQHYRVRPGSGRPISAALAQAKPGDTVDIAPGEYRDEIRLKDGVALAGTDAILRPPEEGALNPAGIFAENIDTASISGLHILAGVNTRFTVGVSVRGGRVSLRDIEVSGAKLSGVEFSAGAGGEVSSSNIHDNQGAGVVTRDTAAPLVENNRIADNGRSTVRSPGLQILSTNPVRVMGNTFLNNGAEAVWLIQPPTPELLGGNVFALAGGPVEAKGRPRDVRVTTRTTR